MKKMGAWMLFTIVTAVQLLFIACNASELTGRSTTVDPYVARVRRLAFDTQFEALSKKLPLYEMTALSFAMLADGSLATPQERKDILAWFGKQGSCRKGSEEIHRSQWPSDIFALFQEENSEAVVPFGSGSSRSVAHADDALQQHFQSTCDRHC
jgi:hypothetical protein